MILEYSDEEYLEEDLEESLYCLGFVDEVSEIPSKQPKVEDLLKDQELINKFLEINKVTLCKPSGSLEQTIKVSEFGVSGVQGVYKW